LKVTPAALVTALLAAPLLAIAGSPGDSNDSAVVSPAIAIDTPVIPNLETKTPQEDTEIATAAEPEIAAPAIPNFAIDYNVRYLAFGGKLIFSLQQIEGDKTYRVSAVTKARGLTKLLMGDDLLEQADFTYADDQITPLRYQLDSGKKSGEDTGEIIFDWESNIADSIHEGSPATLNLGPDIYDRLSADIIVIMDLRNGRAPRTLYIAEKNDVREYTFTPRGEATIETPAGTFETDIYLRQRDGSSRSTLIWYARNAGFLPVRMEQLKDGKTSVTSVATSIALTPPED